MTAATPATTTEYSSEMPSVQVDDWKSLQAHPYANIFPMLEGTEMGELVRDITICGLREPIVLDPEDGSILDGRNRHRACVIADRRPRFVVWDGRGGTRLDFVWSLNMKRRHLSTSQKALASAEYAAIIEAEMAVLEPEPEPEPAVVDVATVLTAGGGHVIRPDQVVLLFMDAIKGLSTRAAQEATGVDDVTITRLRKDPARAVNNRTLVPMFTYLQSIGLVGHHDELGKPSRHKHRKAARAVAAEKFGVAPRTVEHGAKVLEDGVPELQDAVRQGTVAVSAASAVAALPAEEQAAVVAQGPAAVAEKARDVRQLVTETRREVGKTPWARLSKYLEKLVPLIPPVTLTDDEMAEACADPDFVGSDLYRYSVRVHEFLGRVVSSTQSATITQPEE